VPEIVEAHASEARLRQRVVELLDYTPGLGRLTEAVSEHEPALMPFRPGPKPFCDLALLVFTRPHQPYTWRGWSTLSAQQLGRYGERLAHLEFSAHGFDVYVPDVDDRSVDFVVRSGNRKFIEIQVKSIRNRGYVFMRKRLFQPYEDLYVALLVFANGQQPDMYLIPSMTWLALTIRAGFSSRDYGTGLKSKPEWGLQVTAKTRVLLEDFRFDRAVAQLARS